MQHYYSKQDYAAQKISVYISHRIFMTRSPEDDAGLSFFEHFFVFFQHLNQNRKIMKIVKDPGITFFKYTFLGENLWKDYKISTYSVVILIYSCIVRILNFY